MAASSRVKEFISLFTAHERRLRAYVMTLVPRTSDVDDVMQQSSLVLWEKFDQYRAGSNFFAWGCSIARFEAKRFLFRKGRDSALFSERFVDQVAGRAEDITGELTDRRLALEQCLKRLQPTQRQMLGLRYQDGCSLETVAKSLNRSIDSTYKAISRLRLTLFDCITRRLVEVES
jgi:RNA polymerase sigma-70 factor (ECF subfamily)